MTTFANGILLSILALGTALIVPLDVFGEEIEVNSIAFENTTIIEFTNIGTKDIETFRMWLGSDFEFESFKTEKGWTGQKTPQGLIIFTSTDPLKPGETVKFGVKTNNPKPGLNWKTLDENDEQISIGKTLSKDLEKYEEKSKTDEKPPEVNTEETKTTTGILDESIFRIIPEKPSSGSTIRVTGEKFTPMEQFEFYLDDKKITDFETNDGGRFMMTVKIPENQQAERVNFIVKDDYGMEKQVSIRLSQTESRVPETEIVELTISGINEVFHRGEHLEISGTAQPGSAITVTVINPNGVVITTEPADVDQKGVWKLSKPIIVPFDAPFGKYTAEISDGRSTITREWSLESSKIIDIVAEKQKFAPGDLMKFSGTAVPDKQISFILSDPVGKEITSSVEQTDQSGFVSFEYQTSETSIKGTYTLIITQEEEKEITYAGLGELAEIPVNLVFDKLNYKTNESPVITFTGQPFDIVNLLIIDPGDKQKGDIITITLGPEASAKYTLDVTGYSNGVYTAVASKGNAKSSVIFSVGLQVGSGEIQINTTKLEYSPGDPVLVLGETGADALITLSLLDPEGTEILTREIPSDKYGKIADDTIKIPIDAEAGIWKIRATSGANFDNVEIEITKVKEEGLIVSVPSITTLPAIGKVVNIKVIGAQQTVVLEIISEDGTVLEKLEVKASSSGEVSTPWPVPKDTPLGTYTIKVKDSVKTAETTFTLEK